MGDIEDNLTRWPDVPRFCFGPGVRGLDANIDWVLAGPHSMTGYVEGYRRAAVAVFDEAVRTRTSPEYAIFPLAFLWRHHVELALKEIIATGRSIAGDPWGFPEHHRLMDLWRDAKLHVVEMGPPHSPEIENVEANLREFEKVDPFSLGFRYPVERRTGTRTLANAPATVNLETLHAAMDAVSNFLSAVQSVLTEQLDALVDAASHYR